MISTCVKATVYM